LSTLLAVDRRFGILGGGFGLYGWMPAIARFASGPIYTLRRYEQAVLARQELRQYYDRLLFVDDEQALMSQVDAIVCAQRPVDQYALVKKYCGAGWDGVFILEKPLAPTPKQAKEICDCIVASGNRILMGFSLQYTSWALNVAHIAKNSTDSEILIEWRFLAHHYANGLLTWKRYVDDGGGALRFYAIHLIGLLASLQEWQIDKVALLSDHEGDGGHLPQSSECTKAVVTMSSKGNHIQITCDSYWCSASQFTVTASRAGCRVYEFRDQSPFPKAAQNYGQMLRFGEDARIPYLVYLLRNAEKQKWAPNISIRDHVSLWQMIERSVKP
jgi:predicted dehydrogenase